MCPSDGHEFLVATAAPAHAQNHTDFSIDSASPEVNRFTIGDLILFDGSNVALSVQQLGLPANANIDGFSYGKDRLVPAGVNFFVALENYE